MIDAIKANSQSNDTGCIGLMVVLLVWAAAGWAWVVAGIGVAVLYGVARLVVAFGRRNVR